MIELSIQEQMNVNGGYMMIVVTDNTTGGSWYYDIMKTEQANYKYLEIKRLGHSASTRTVTY